MNVLMTLGKWVSRHRWLWLGVLGLGVLSRCVFTLEVNSFALVSRLGQWARVLDEPGLHLKWPHEQVTTVSRKIQQTRLPPNEYLTTDKKNIVMSSLALWRVHDARRFMETLGDPGRAQARLEDLVVAATGAVLGTYPSGALLSASAQVSQYNRIVEHIQHGLNDFARAVYGIDVLNIRITAIALPEQNKESVFERMKAERGRISKALRSAGEYEAKKIIAAADREKVQIEMQAYASARLLKAQGDSEAARIFAQAYGKNPAFYKFTRALQAYDKILDQNTTVFLPAEAEVLSVLRKPSGARGTP